MRNEDNSPGYLRLKQVTQEGGQNMEAEKIARISIVLGGLLMLLALTNYMQNQDLIHDGMNWRTYKSFEDNCVRQNARTVLSCEFTYFPNQTNKNLTYQVGITGEKNG